MARGSPEGNTMVVSLASTAGAMAAASIARRAMKVSWRAVTGEAPPDDPQSKDTDVVVAILWAVATGAAIGVARLLVERELVGRLAHRGS